MRYPAIIVLVVGGLILLGWLLSGRRMPVLVHVGAVAAALATVAFLLWLRSRGKEIELEAWGAVVAVVVMVYITYAFGHAMHAEETRDDTAVDRAPPPTAVAAPEAWTPAGSAAILTPDEKARAAQVRVWTVLWQLPDKDWEAFCISADEAERLFRAKEEDHLLKRWGRVHKRDPQTLLAWYEDRVRGPRSSGQEIDHRTAREILRRADAGEREPVVIRTG